MSTKRLNTSIKKHNKSKRLKLPDRIPLDCCTQYWQIRNRRPPPGCLHESEHLHNIFIQEQTKFCQRCRFVDCDNFTRGTNCEYLHYRCGMYYCWVHSLLSAISAKNMSWFNSIVEDQQISQIFKKSENNPKIMEWFVQSGFPEWNHATSWFLQHTNIFHDINREFAHSYSNMRQFNFFSLADWCEMTAYGYISIPCKTIQLIPFMQKYCDFLQTVAEILLLELNQDVFSLICDYEMRLLQMKNAKNFNHIDSVIDRLRRHFINSSKN